MVNNFTKLINYTTLNVKSYFKNLKFNDKMFRTLTFNYNLDNPKNKIFLKQVPSQDTSNYLAPCFLI